MRPPVIAAALASTAALGGALGCAGDAGLAPDAPYAVAVASFAPGERAGFGQDALPDVVLGPPRGAGELRGSLDVLSLGVGGSVTVELGADAVDLPGPDLIVFENAFRISGGGTLFVEPAAVSLSEDGQRFVELPCEEAAPFTGCAGLSPVHAHASDASIDPRDPERAGGDAFDLAAAGLSRARFVRVRDLGLDLGGFGIDNAGFDLDAVAVIHAAE